MISHSTELKPGTSRGRSASVTGRVSSSFRHGIWMISFIGRRLPRYRLVILSSLMEAATLSRRRADARALDADLIARILFGLLCVAAVVAFFVYPTYPNYDSYYSLLWGREVLDLQLPGFEGFRVPTEHPLAIAAGALFSLFGRSGDRLFVAMILASFLWLIWGVYKLGRVSFTPLVGGVAPLLTLTRFDFGFLAARAYIDIPYMALVVWAAVLEAQRPRRGTAVLVTLALAGLLRPEAWVRVSVSSAATPPTSGVNETRPSLYTPQISHRNEARIIATNIRSPDRPNSENSAPATIASGGSVRTRKPSKPRSRRSEERRV